MPVILWRIEVARHTFLVAKKLGSMTRKYLNHKLQANPRHCEEEPQKNLQSQDIRKTIKVKQPALSSTSRLLQKLERH